MMLCMQNKKINESNPHHKELKIKMFRDELVNILAVKHNVTREFLQEHVNISSFADL